MVVAHNLLSMNAGRQLGIVTDYRKKTTEKLSSGYKINRAADDAAGLQISEKMRSQIRGLTQASANCQDGVSLCQVADGALTETHSILQRMNELCVKSANGTNTSADRAAIQSEIRQLNEEIDRIANSTSYNGEIFPLNNRVQKAQTIDQIQTTNGLGTNFIISETTITAPFRTQPGQLIADGVTYNNGESVTIKGLLVQDADTGRSMVVLKDAILGVGKSRIETFSSTIGSITLDDLLDDHGYFAVQWTSNLNSKYYLGFDNSVPPTTGIISKDISHIGAAYKNYLAKAQPFGSQGSKDRSIVIQAGAANKEEQRISLNFVDATRKGLKLTEPDLNVSTKDGALSAIKRVKDAIDTVSGYRSYFGATQNRLEHTIANLDNIVENTQQAESQIRDTDMAMEMVEFSKQNILNQAGISMLSSANQGAANVLTLLQ